MILSGSAVHTKGLGSSLVSLRKRLMAAWRSTIEQNTPRLRRRLPSLAEEALDGVEPGGRGRRVVEDETRMPRQPGSGFGVLVRAVIVEDHVDDLAGGDLGPDRFREAGEFL